MKVYAPFSKEQVENINHYQIKGTFHPFTCCSPEEILECERASGKNEGLLIAHENHLICPCKNFTQLWVHDFMTKKIKKEL